jgi:hypothetical protein
VPRSGHDLAAAAISLRMRNERRERLVWTYAILGLAGAANVAGLVVAQTPPFKCLSMLGIVAAAVAAMLVHHRRHR